MPSTKPITDHEDIRRWAESQGAIPAEVLPHVLDSEPALLRFMLKGQAASKIDVRPISWEEFFAKFDQLGLCFAYNPDKPEQNEILQIEEKSPYRYSYYRGET